MLTYGKPDENSKISEMCPTPIGVDLSAEDLLTIFYYAHDKRCVISHGITAPKQHRKCESPRFIWSRESCLVPPDKLRLKIKTKES